MLLLLISEAYAGGDGLPPDLNAIAFHAINFLLFVGLLTYLLRDKLRDALANRAANVKREIDESNQSRKDAAQRFEELEARLDGFETELEKMKEDAVEDADKEHNSILARAEEDAGRSSEARPLGVHDVQGVEERMGRSARRGAGRDDGFRERKLRVAHRG